MISQKFVCSPTHRPGGATCAPTTRAAHNQLLSLALDSSRCWSFIRFQTSSRQTAASFDHHTSELIADKVSPPQAAINARNKITHSRHERRSQVPKMHETERGSPREAEKVVTKWPRLKHYVATRTTKNQHQVHPTSKLNQRLASAAGQMSPAAGCRLDQTNSSQCRFAIVAVYLLTCCLLVGQAAAAVSAGSGRRSMQMPAAAHDADPMEPCYLANNRASESLTISESTPVGTVVGELMVSSERTNVPWRCPKSDDSFSLVICLWRCSIMSQLNA